jgi:hypothetical protein
MHVHLRPLAAKGEEKRREEKSIHVVPQLHGAPISGYLCIAR